MGLLWFHFDLIFLVFCACIISQNLYPSAFLLYGLGLNYIENRDTRKRLQHLSSRVQQVNYFKRSIQTYLLAIQFIVPESSLTYNLNIDNFARLAPPAPFAKKTKIQRVFYKLLIDPEVKAYESSLRRKASLVNQLDPTDDALRRRRFVSRQNSYSGAWLSAGLRLPAFQLSNV